jgi:DnaK suppressor protein
MTPEQLERIRAHLDEERASAIAELRRYGADPHSEKVEGLQGIDDGFADSAAATAERSEILAFIDSARDRLADVDAALAKMDEGTYGICEVCGKEISEARLEARPLAVRCVDCAAAA